MDSLSTQLSDVANLLFKRAAPEQGGLISGDNPTAYNAGDPLRLWVIQVVIIIAMTQLLSLFLSRLRQPRVIAEVIGGIILGPTVMGRIPHFKNRIFPDASMPLLNLTATIGLVLFLFLVGLEIDTRIIKRNARVSSIISVAGLVVPLGLGAALGVIIYHQFISHTVNFGYFVLFTAVAIGITAFPVLCRILTELRLLDTNVGVVTLSAGIGNDVVGWILLALAVALVNASNGLTALWVLLSSVAYVIFLFYPVRWGFRWLAKRTGSLETGQPTTSMMTITILVVFISAFFTDVIGVHAIFGGFLAGLIVPHDNGFAIALVEKFEDLTTILFLPIYFTLSGLRTNLGLLNNGVTWGYTILICVFAFVSKFFACATAARALGFSNREAGAIGSLMSCKGLVELIVLNVGLQAHILDTRTFSMFVVHALVLTVMTTPLTILFYPERLRTHVTTAKDKPTDGADEGAERKPSEDETKTKFAMVLDKIEQLSAAMTLTQLLQPPSTSSRAASVSNSSVDEKASETNLPVLPSRPVTPTQPRITIDALRLIELTDRTSAVLKSQAAELLLHSDPIVSVFRTFGYLNRLPISATLSVVSHNEFPSSVANHVRESGSQMVILPWTRTTSAVTEDQAGASTPTRNPFDGLFKHSSGGDRSSAVVHTEFIRKVFLNTPCDVALFMDRGITPLGSSYTGPSNQLLFLPFFGGPDDRLALSFVVQLCGNYGIFATVVRMQKTEDVDLTPSSSISGKPINLTVASQHNTVGLAADTVYGNRDTQTRLQSDTADNLILSRYREPSDTRSLELTAALAHITWRDCASPRPLHDMLDAANSEVDKHSGRNPVVIVGRSRRMAVDSHQAELRQLITEKNAGIGNEVQKTLGDVGAAFVAAGMNVSLLVVQASA